MRRRYCGFAETVLVTVALVFSVWLGNSAEALAGCVGTSCEVYANQDTFVGSDDKAANYCSEATIMAGASSQYSYVTLLKFDNPLSGVPNGAKVKNVLLTLWFQVGGVSPGTCTTLYVWKGAFGWSECSVKWNTMGNTGAEIGSSGSICDSKSYAEVSLSLSESDIASIASNGILVGAKQMGTGYASFKTKNAGKPARIEFDYEPVGPCPGECTPGQTQSQACGNCGTKTRTCSNSCSWGSWGSCNGQGSCSPGQSQSQACGSCGTQTRTCSNSCSWGSWGSCNGQGVCSPGQTTSCSGQCGSGTKTCSGSCQWGSCSAPDVGECTPGQNQSQACGNCGTQTRTCSNSCSWGSWGSCNGQGSCSPGQSQSQACGSCGTQTRTCSNSCSWGSWGSCNGQGSCTPGQSGSSQSCGNCGTKKQTCNNSCQYEWGSCTGEGTCTPGQSQNQACGSCGTQTKTCSNSCSWGSWGSCGGDGDCSPGETKECEDCGQSTCGQTCNWGACFGDDDNLCDDYLCCTDEYCDADGTCVYAAMDCEPGSSCQESSCQCVEGCGQFTEVSECQGNMLFSCENGSLKKEDCAVAGGICVSEVPGYCCTPACAGKKCGDDGCGGSCGDCPEGKTCLAGACEASGGDCDELCKGKECSFLSECDCGSCPEGFVCNQDWMCDPVPNSCGAADPACNEDNGENCLSCPSDCPCSEDETCVETGVCCAPNCSNQECGADGCGGTCGICPDATPVCINGKCHEEDDVDIVCVPDCTGKECGDDGCGGECGSCPGAAPLCEAYSCVPDSPPDNDGDAGAGGGGCSVVRGNGGLGLAFLTALFCLLMLLQRRRSRAPRW